MSVPNVMPIERKRQTPTTDIGNAERLIAAHGRDLHYVTAWKSWLVWNGKKWERDDTRELQRRAKKTVRGILREARQEKRKERKKDLTKHWLASEANGRIHGMIERAEAEAGVAVRYQEFDQQPFLFNLKNGTLNLSTGQLGPHDRDHLITKYADVDYVEGATCPLWLGFLAKIFQENPEIIPYLQRAVGYSLTGDTREQCLHLLHGSGSNGKSTFLEVLQALTGDYGVQADFATFVEKKGDGPRNDVARLAGARMVRSSEIGEGKRLNESLVKSLTGQDTIAARYLYSEAFEFRPAFKLWLAANHKPVIRGTDNAIWRRVRLIPFTTTITDAEKDETLKDRLLTELPGILQWSLEGCQQWLERGLQPPESVTVATANYKNESDILGSFLEDCCELGSGLEVPATELYTAYKRWAHDNGEFELSQTAFGRRIEERGFDVRKNGLKYRRGLRLVPNVTARGEPIHSYGKDND